MRPVEIKKGIYWVGAIDWKLRDFHGYKTPRGTTYNAYLICDEKTVLIDTVKDYKTEEMLSRIKCIIDPREIDIIVTNHVEMDHSGSLPALSKIARKAKIITSPKGHEAIKAHFDISSEIKEVTTAEEVSIGQRTLHFLLAPMVHWPDSMATWLADEKILFSNDAFGQHMASSERFDDELALDVVYEEAAKYYANIVLPYSQQVLKVLESAGKLDIDMIAPSHGLIWRKNVSGIKELYLKWAERRVEQKAVVVYDTMWGSTEKMASSICSAFESKGVPFTKRDLKTSDISDIMTDILSAGYLAVGSPTLNRAFMPTVAAFLTYVKGLKPNIKKALAFGSYGWGGEALKQIESSLAECGFDLFQTQKVRYRPRENDLSAIEKELAGELDNLL